MAQVVLEGVSKEFPGGIRALDRVDLQVADGEFLVLVGPSGCGKSTALRLIAGLEQPTGGVISIGDRVVNGLPARRRDVAMVFQSYALYPHLTVAENLAFGARLRDGGWSGRLFDKLARPARAKERADRRANLAARIKEFSQAFGVASLLERLPGQLSGGERQRVALAKALVRSPAASLLDEPLSNVDAQLRVEIRRELKRLHQRQPVTTIYVTHDQVEALTLGDRIGVMRDGQIQQIGQAAEICDRPANLFVAGFIGSPPMNLCLGRLRNTEWDEDGLRFETASWGAQATPESIGRLSQYRDRPIVLGVRPRDARLVADGDPTGDTIKGTIGLIEPLGDSRLVEILFETAGPPHDPGLPDPPVSPLGAPASAGSNLALSSSLMCKIGARYSFRPGDRARVALDMGQAHWFDPLSGLRIDF
ncbi:MAG TPA: ABC transporter ATP-binding protein [Pirellulales bacterium]